jgi:hypothetical protein
MAYDIVGQHKRCRRCIWTYDIAYDMNFELYYDIIGHYIRFRRATNDIYVGPTMS